ncbi:MAG: branched-chain amino acid ABC transporter permease [Deltaproteobacteria bacterium HGW-Deltaproteobacteria-15]|jgi:branched-chain amino acid transport system permease protein|nr:MAG: branched-chain amino acid ABC transporter permease [Deltaproteobacteria bacterium HGW-Deltaproteobacteria-15]
MNSTLKKTILFTLLLALALLPLIQPPTYFLSFIFKVFLYVILSASWNLIGGFAGYLSFGHVAFFGIGVYVSAMLFQQLAISPFLGAIPAGLFAGLVAWIIGYPCLRLRGPYFAVVTLCFAFIADLVVKNWSFLGGSEGIHLKLVQMDIQFSRSLFYEIFLCLAGVTVYMLRKIQTSKFGLGLASIREDEEVAQTLCIPTARLKTRAFVLSAFFPGVAGGIYAYYISYVHPDIVFDINISILIVLMALFGGGRSWEGPVIGAVSLSIVNEFLSIFIRPEFARIIYGTMFMVVIIFMPDGIVPFLKRNAKPRSGVVNSRNTLAL